MQQIVIEFVGLPGSGKSTVSDAFCNSLQNKGVAFATNNELSGWCFQHGKIYKLFLLLLNPVRTVYYLSKVFCYLSKLDNWTFETIKRTLHAPFAGVYLNNFLNSTDVEVMVLDQGEIQSLWSIGALSSKFDIGPIKNLISYINSRRKFVYICIDADCSTVINRIAERHHGRSRFDEISDKQLVEGIKKSAPLMQEIITYLSDNFDSLTLRSDDDVISKVASIDQFISAYIH